MRLAREDPFIALPKNEEQDVQSILRFSTLLQAGYYSRVNYRARYEGSRVPGYEVVKREHHIASPN
jgi:hypothetical protein